MSVTLLPRIFFPGEVCFRPGSLVRLKYLPGKRLAVIAGRHVFGDNEKIGKMREYLTATGADFNFFEGVKGEPDMKQTEDLFSRLVRYHPDVLIACGGGSIIDSAKVIKQHLEKSSTGKRNRIYFVAVPTTLGSGSEASRSGVLLDGVLQRKVIVVSDSFLPDLVILDANLTLTLPQDILIFSVIDALTHSLEAYCSLRTSFLVQELAVASGKIIKEQLALRLSSKSDSKVDEKLQWAAFLGGVVQDAASVGACHALAHSLGGYGLSHGLANSLVFSEVLTFNSRRSELPKQFARRLGFKNTQDLANFVRSLLIRLKVSSGWSHHLRRGADIEVLAESARQDICLKTNPVPMTLSDLRSILRTTK